MCFWREFGANFQITKPYCLPVVKVFLLLLEVTKQSYAKKKKKEEGKKEECEGSRQDMKDKE